MGGSTYNPEALEEYTRSKAGIPSLGELVAFGLTKQYQRGSLHVPQTREIQRVLRHNYDWRIRLALPREGNLWLDLMPGSHPHDRFVVVPRV